MSGCEQQCPKDSPLMIAWEAHKATDEYKNSLSWATRYIQEDDPAEIERIRATGANAVTKANKEQYVEGSLWATFMAGFLATNANGAQSPSDPTAERREIVARCIIGPRLPVPYGSMYTLEELREVRWKQASKAERLDALNAADAILAALDGGAGE